MALTRTISWIVGPAIFWLVYLYYKDRFKPEPFFQVIVSYLFGILSAVLCFQAYRLLPLIGIPEDPSIIMDQQRLQFLFYCLGPVGLMEEFFKFLPFLYVIYFFRAFDEKIDGIIYASIISLGFASYENIFHLSYLKGFELIGRAFAVPLIHGIFSSIWGYVVGSARLSRGSVVKAAFVSIIIAAFFHGIFDFLLPLINIVPQAVQTLEELNKTL